MFSLFFPKKVLETESKINGKIVVEEWLGKLSLKIGGLSQSGGLVKDIWRKALKKINISHLTNNKNNNILILGLGCGTLAELISKKLPEAKIIGVEIDPKVIEIGKKYFSLNKIPNLKIYNTDAYDYIQNSEKRNDSCYRVIFIDTFIGDNFPEELESERFLEGLKKILTEDGLIIFNRLYYKEKKRKNRPIF